MKNKNWFLNLGIVVAVLIALSGGLATLGALPWATASDMQAFVELKNQDNLWYRELNAKVAGMESDIKHIMASVNRIERTLDVRHNH